MQLIFSRHAQGTTDFPLPAHHNGSGVRIGLPGPLIYADPNIHSTDFVVSKVSPNIQTQLGYKMFLMFATVNIGAMATFSLCVPPHFVAFCDALMLP
jgi:hypothetical protein